jgi:hypothetical protein
MLTKEQLEKAVRYNERRHALKCGKQREYAFLVASFQAKHGLTIDGMCGPKTEASLAEQVSCIETITIASQQFIINGVKVDVPFLGFRFTNYSDDGEPLLRHSARDEADLVDFAVLHESVTVSKEDTISVLERRKLGVHFVLDPEGNWSQHGDPVLHHMAHAGSLNDCSFGIEIVNPYVPDYNTEPKVFTKSIPARWWTWTPGEKRYVLPTDAQLNSLALVMPWLCGVVGVPYEFPTSVLDPRFPRMDATTLERSYRGVVAHRDFEPNRSDGRYLLEYLEARHG